MKLYRDYLINKLQEAGVKGPIFKTMKELKVSSAIHLGAVLFENERFEKDGSKKTLVVNNVKVKRVKKLKRYTKYTIVIGAAVEDDVESIFANFLATIDEGLDDGSGNYVELEIEEADWVTEKDSILKSTVAVQVAIEFIGGVYQEYSFKNISSVNIEMEGQ